jgi:transcription elongation factor Elf1
MDERDFFNERPEPKPATYTCPRCRRQNEYHVRWIRRTRKERLPAGATERDRALFGKLRDHLIRVDDTVVCKSCGKTFEIPSMQSLVFVQ